MGSNKVTKKEIFKIISYKFTAYEPKKHSRGRLTFYEEQNYHLLSALRFLYGMTEGGDTLIRRYFNLDPYYFFKYVSSPFLSSRIYNKLREGALEMEKSCIGTRRAFGRLIIKLLKTKRLAKSSFSE